ncbi:MAG: ribonuclease HII [Spirochaetaceae bacterium]|nr:ribonuclease HII [Spirochaetaceae bacterium]
MICGIDEAGRGPLAGPVCAAAVLLPDDFPLEVLADSKKLSEKRREKAAELIYAGAAAWGIGWASHSEIDAINILQASLLAMQRAFINLTANKDRHLCANYTNLIDTIIVDGLYVPDLSASLKMLPLTCSLQALVQADDKIPAVMAASILAKTARDKRMCEYAKEFPQYHYEKHKGYPTKEHREILAKYGPSPIQRLSFRAL